MQIENAQNGIVCAHPNPIYNETSRHMLALTVFFSFTRCLRGFLLIFALQNQFFLFTVPLLIWGIMCFIYKDLCC